MITIQQLKLPPDHSEQDLKKAVARTLRLSEKQPFSFEIIRQSVDARKKPDIFYVYTVDVTVSGDEKKILKKARNRSLSLSKRTLYHFPETGKEPLPLPPVIVGTGPAGLFCGLMLARAGYRPVLLERGQAVEERQKAVEHFWQTGVLNPECNVQFGEGGAGTFSDGKLNTLVKDSAGRIRFVLETFVKHGADPDILYSYKPHVGTDVLAYAVKNIREEITGLGGKVLFGTKLTDLTLLENGNWELTLQETSGGSEEQKRRFHMEARAVVLAIGHSARDTFHMLYEKGLAMEAKSFAVGLRIEHPQKLIDRAMYGEACRYQMPPAPYKVTHRLADGRGVYSFCMCPGGYVVNASSEPGRLAVNGMSYRGRDGENANSAIVVTVSPEDYGGSHPLSGVEFQRRLEEKAFQEGGGKIPLQRFADYCQGKSTTEPGTVRPQMKGGYRFANVRSILPETIAADIQEGIWAFGKQIPGFDHPDALLAGVESRTSSPVRIGRNTEFVSNFPGIYPCGEGAGYAGGITSAAVDGIKVAEAVASKFSIDFLTK